MTTQLATKRTLSAAARPAVQKPAVIKDAVSGRRAFMSGMLASAAILLPQYPALVRCRVLSIPDALSRQ
jgi:hypothetical protein